MNRLLGQKHHDYGPGRKCGLRLDCDALGFRQAREDRSLFRMRRDPLTTSSLYSPWVCLYIDKAREPLVPGLPCRCVQLVFIDGFIVSGLI